MVEGEWLGGRLGRGNGWGGDEGGGMVEGEWLGGR